MDNKSKVIIFIDETNLHYGFKKHGWDMDYEKFVNWLKQKYDVLDIYFCKGKLPYFAFCVKYANRITVTKTFVKYKQLLRQEFKRLRSLGYIIVTKIVDYIPNKKTVDRRKVVEYEKKCNFDVEITTIALDRINEYDEVVLCSGDGDFAYLIKYLKNRGKRITVISFKDRLSQHLKDATKFIITVGSLRPMIKKDPASARPNRH